MRIACVLCVLFASTGVFAQERAITTPYQRDAGQISLILAQPFLVPFFGAGRSIAKIVWVPYSQDPPEPAHWEISADTGCTIKARVQYPPDAARKVQFDPFDRICDELK